ncbi:hypothetical protein VE00_04286 [Neofusicoccum parvum]|nr:hypothetical protein VE00_04286 [Neofusicoccum parvum]
MGIRDQKEEIFNYIKKLQLPYTIIDVGWWYACVIPRVPSGRTDYARITSLIGDNIIPADGNVPIAVTDVHDIGRYVARIITDPRTLNKMVFAYNEVVTFNQAFESMEDRSSEHVDRNYISDGVLVNAINEMKERMQNDKTDQLAVYKSYWYQYFYSCGVRGDNTPYVAEYLGYLNAKDLYPDFKGLSLGKYLTDVLDGKAKQMYA